MPFGVLSGLIAAQQVHQMNQMAQNNSYKNNSYNLQSAMNGQNQVWDQGLLGAQQFGYGPASACSTSHTTFASSTPTPLPEKNQPTKGLMKTMIDDVKEFIKEHRSIIYFVVVLLLIDRFLLDGKLTTKIKGMAERLLGAVEKKIDKATETTPAIETKP